MSIENENYKSETYVYRKSFKDSKTVFVFIIAWKLRQFYSFSSEDVDFQEKQFYVFLIKWSISEGNSPGVRHL